MEKWFASQDRLTQIILLIIPVIGWLVEIFVRLFAVIRLHSKKNIAGLIVFIILGGFILLNLIDIIVLTKTDDLMLID